MLVHYTISYFHYTRYKCIINSKYNAKNYYRLFIIFLNCIEYEYSFCKFDTLK